MIFEEQLKSLKDKQNATIAAFAAMCQAQKEYRKADEALNERTRQLAEDIPLYRAYRQLNSDLTTAYKKATEFYCYWYRTGPDGDDKDFESPFPETEEFLSPYVEQLRNTAIEIKKKSYDIIEDLKDKLFNEAMGDVKRALDQATEKYQTASQNEIDAKSALRSTPEGNIINLIDEFVIAHPEWDLNTFDARKDNIFTVYHTKKGYEIGMVIAVPITASTVVDYDSFYAEGKDIVELTEEVNDLANNIAEKINDSLDKFVLPGYTVEVYHDDNNSDIDDYHGDYRYNRGFYDRDTGESEPTGYFYDGKVTCSGTAYLDIVIKKEEE